MKETIQFYFSKKTTKIIILILVGFLLYLNVLHSPLFWDDYDGILHNFYIQNWAYWPKFFSENLIAGAGLLSDYWRPMILVIFSLGWHLWQDNPVGYHLINIIFHISNALLLFFILRKILKKETPAFLIALVFLIHPVQTEAVSYVSGIGDPLSAFFVLLSTYFFINLLEKGKIKFLIVSIFCYIFSLMSKETAIITPAIMFLIGLPYIKVQKIQFRKIIIYLLPFFIVALVYFGLRLTVLNFKNTLNLYNEENLFTKRIDIRLLTFFKTLPFYFNFMFMPIDLYMERQIAIPKSIFDPLVLLGIFIFAIIVFLLIKYFNKDYIFSLGILWFLVALFPMSNILIPVSGLIYEHWLYLPLIGIFLSLFWIMEKLLKQYQLEKIGVIVLIIFLIFLSIRTVIRNLDWRDPVYFYQQIIEHNPTSYRIWNNLGIEAEKQNKILLAEQAYKEATKIDSQNPIAYHNLGVLYYSKIGDYQKAESYLKQAIEKDKTFFYSYIFLAKIYWEQKELNKAKEILEAYLTIGSRADIYFILSQIYKGEGNIKQSFDYIQKVLELDPLNNLYQKEFDLLKQLQK
ncbi:MAG: tetratricopeptide repeat protein [Minisyncoccia bacterium]